MKNQDIETENPDRQAISGRMQRLVRLLQDAENYMSTLAPHMIDRQGPMITRQLIGELAKTRDEINRLHNGIRKIVDNYGNIEWGHDGDYGSQRIIEELEGL